MQRGPSSNCYWRVFLVAGPSGGRTGGLKGSVPTLAGVQKGCGNRVGVADVLRVHELSLVGHYLSGLLAVEDGEVGRHVDEDAAVRGQAAGGLSPHEGRGGRDRAGRGGRSR